VTAELVRSIFDQPDTGYIGGASERTIVETQRC
jgi:hypothetical protein